MANDKQELERKNELLCLAIEHQRDELARVRGLLQRLLAALNGDGCIDGVHARAKIAQARKEAAQTLADIDRRGELDGGSKAIRGWSSPEDATYNSSAREGTAVNQYPHSSTSEQSAYNRQVAGSNPAAGTILSDDDDRKVAEYRSQEEIDLWFGTIQTAIGNAGRIGDRVYFDYCLALIVNQAEWDGLIPSRPRTQQMLEELRPRIAKIKAIICERLLATFPQSSELVPQGADSADIGKLDTADKSAALNCPAHGRGYQIVCTCNKSGVEMGKVNRVDDSPEKQMESLNKLREEMLDYPPCPTVRRFPSPPKACAETGGEKAQVFNCSETDAFHRAFGVPCSKCEAASPCVHCGQQVSPEMDFSIVRLHESGECAE